MGLDTVKDQKKDIDLRTRPLSVQFYGSFEVSTPVRFDRGDAAGLEGPPIRFMCVVEGHYYIEQ